MIWVGLFWLILVNFVVVVVVVVVVVICFWSVFFGFVLCFFGCFFFEGVNSLGLFN